MFPAERPRPKQRSFLLPALGIVGAGVAAMIGFGVLVGVLATGAANRRAAEEGQYHLALTEIRGAVDQLAANPDTAVIDVRAKSTGLAGQVEHVTKVYLASVIGDRHGYRAALAALGFPQFLKGRNLATENLGGVLNKLKQARVLEGRYQVLSNQRVSEFRTNIGRLPLTLAQKSEVADELADNSPGLDAQRDQVWDDEGEMIDQFGLLVSMLASTRSHWKFNGRQMVFSGVGLANAYNERIANIREIAVSQKALQSQAIQAADRKLGDVIDDTN